MKPYKLKPQIVFMNNANCSRQIPKEYLLNGTYREILVYIYVKHSSIEQMQLISDEAIIHNWCTLPDFDPSEALVLLCSCFFTAGEAESSNSRTSSSVIMLTFNLSSLAPIGIPCTSSSPTSCSSWTCDLIYMIMEINKQQVTTSTLWALPPAGSREASLHKTLCLASIESSF